jgi:hypothetical protein
MPYQPESFFETNLTAAITASQNTITVTTAPNITAGYMVIEANTSNREIIKYTGVTGTTLTGVVRGLATYGSDDSAGTGKAHAAGVDIANKDVHYYYAQYFDFLMGTSATGANSMRIGDGNTISAGAWLDATSGRFWFVNTSSLSAYWGLSSNGQFVCSEDGTTSYVVSAGGSGVTAGNTIDITAGVVTVARLSTGGLQVSGSKLKVGYDGTTLKSTSAGELYLNLSASNYWSYNVSCTSAFFTNLPYCETATPTSGSHLTPKNYVDDLSYVTPKMGVSARGGDTASGTQAWAHGLGRTPIYVRLNAKKSTGATGVMCFSDGAYNGTNAYCNYVVNDGTNPVAGTDSVSAIVIYDATGKAQTASVTVDSTNINLIWTKTGSPQSNNVQIFWEVH